MQNEMPDMGNINMTPDEQSLLWNAISAWRDAPAGYGAQIAGNAVETIINTYMKKRFDAGRMQEAGHA